MAGSDYLNPFLDCRGRRFAWGERTYIMGVLNVSPESFSGDGFMDPDTAVEQGKRFVEEGADILDVGGESTRPLYTAKMEASTWGGAAGRVASPIDVQVELGRVLPVIQRLAKAVKVPISIDTYKAEVARQALDAGANMVNDVWGLKTAPELAAVAAQYGAPLVLMHNQSGTEYADLMTDIRRGLEASVRQALDAGVRPEKIILDPGFGFGKLPAHNLEILRCLRDLKELGYPILLGTSRKSTIGVVLGLPVRERLEGTAATVAIGIANGADIVRVHDVKAMARVARMADAIVRGWMPEPKE